jgi:hypothetical protein
MYCFLSTVLFYVLLVSIVLFYVLFVSIVLFYVLFVSTVLFYVLFVSIVLFYIVFVSIVLFYVLFVCKCVLYYCHRMSTQLQLTNISYHTINASGDNCSVHSLILANPRISAGKTAETRDISGRCTVDRENQTGAKMQSYQKVLP